MSAEARRELIEQAASELFAQRGYQATTIDEIAGQAGVTAPVVYDHFASKLDLHRRLLERHFAELRLVWRENLSGDGPPRMRFPRAIDAWFAYVETHPYAWRMLFRDTTGEPEVEAIHAEVIAQSRAAILPLFVREREPGGGEEAAESLDVAWEVLRAVLQGLAQWWYEHQEVPRATIVATAMNSLWVGFERFFAGERWRPDTAAEAQ